MVRDLVSDDLFNRSGKGRPRPVGALEWAAKDRDLGRNGSPLGAPRRPRDALVKAEQPIRTSRHQLLGRRFILDDDRDGAKSVAELGRKSLDGVVDQRFEVVGLHRPIICGRRPAR
jgi:hypothetical protein